MRRALYGEENAGQPQKAGKFFRHCCDDGKLDHNDSLDKSYELSGIHFYITNESTLNSNYYCQPLIISYHNPSHLTNNLEQKSKRGDSGVGNRLSYSCGTSDVNRNAFHIPLAMVTI